jgi:hypothetical protein
VVASPGECAKEDRSFLSLAEKARGSWRWIPQSSY